MTFSTTPQPTAAEVVDATNRARPLNTEQLQNLRQLVQIDVQSVRTTMERAYYAERQRIFDEVEAAHEAENKHGDLKGRAEAAMKKYRKERKALVAEAKAAGIRLDLPNVHPDRFGIYDPTLNKKQQEACKDLDKQYRDAHAALNEQASAANRQVLVASISADAEDILKILPKPEDFLRGALQLGSSSNGEATSRA